MYDTQHFYGIKIEWVQSWTCSRETCGWRFGVCRQQPPGLFYWTAGQQGKLDLVCVCACVCRRSPQVVACCWSAGHVPLIWNCQQLLWQQGKQKLSASGVRERWRRWNEAQTFSRILCTACCFSHTPGFLTFSDPLLLALFFAPLWLSFCRIFVTSLSLSVSLSLTVCLPCDIEVWESAGSIGEEARQRGREGKSVRANKCERGRWKSGKKKIWGEK